MKKITLILLVFTLTVNLTAQSPLEAGLFGGIIVYQGDLSENDYAELSELNLAFGGLLRYHFNDRWMARGHVIYGHISGTDKNAKDPGLYNRGWSYESIIVELTFVGEYHPWGRPREDNAGIFSRQVSPYIGLGAGFVNFNPRVKVVRPQDVGLFPEPQRTTTAISLPIVAGVRFDFSEYYIATFEAGWRITFNDYLDGVSQNGNPNKKDPFIFTGLSLTYFFGYETRFH